MLSLSAHQEGTDSNSPSPVPFLSRLSPACDPQLLERPVCACSVVSSVPIAEMRAGLLVGSWTSNLSSPAHSRSIFSPSVPCSVPLEVNSWELHPSLDGFWMLPAKRRHLGASSQGEVLGRWCINGGEEGGSSSPHPIPVSALHLQQLSYTIRAPASATVL